MSVVGSPGNSAHVHVTEAVSPNGLADGWRCGTLRIMSTAPLPIVPGWPGAFRYPRTRGRSSLPKVIELADARAGSPRVTRLRLVLMLRGLPRPEVQFPVLDCARQQAVWLDLAYPTIDSALRVR